MARTWVIFAIVIPVVVLITAFVVWQVNPFTQSQGGVVSSHLVAIAFDKLTYEPDTAASITVIDPSANTNNATREKIFVQVSSDSDAIGFPVQLDEYRNNSSKFVAHPFKVKLTTLPSNPLFVALHIQSGDKIYVHYGNSSAVATIVPSVTIPSLSDENTQQPVGGVNMTGSNTIPNPFGDYNPIPTVTGISLDYGAVPGCYDDVDNDGICDEWEDVSSTGVNGIVIPYGSATYELDCNPSYFDPATNAYDDCPDPYMQDIYVQVSYMQNPGKISQAPTSAAISDLKAAFYKQGIRLHVMLDSQPIGYYRDTTTVPGSITDVAGSNSFFGIKNAYFGTIQERTCPANIPQSSCSTYLHDYLTAKRQVFHYALFIHAQAAKPTSSGWAEIFGNDMVISLGAFDGGNGSENQIAGTFMHELGHNLNLNHGGAPTDTLNCKPNYLSVMSYTRQFPYFVTNWSLDYSHVRFDLNKNSLVESRGIGNINQKITAYSYKDTAGTWHVVMGPMVQGNQGIDWNGDGVISTTALPQFYEIQNLGIPDCTGTNTATINGFNDWSNINLAFQSSSAFASGAAYAPTSDNEMTRGDVDTLFMKEYGVNSTGKNLEELYKNVMKNQPQKFSHDKADLVLR